MIFKPELAKLILQGKKSQTRRRALGEKTCRYAPGRSYAVQPGRGKLAMGRITILEVRSELLGDLTLRDAKREGFVTTDEFFDYWERLYGSVNRSESVWVLSFKLGDHTDQSRFLAARPGPPSGDYTSEPRLALPGEPEAVSEFEQAQLSKEGWVRHMERKAAEFQRLNARSLAIRLKDAERRGDADAMALVRRDLEQLERQLRSAA